MSVIRNDTYLRRRRNDKAPNKNEGSGLVLKTVNCMNHRLGCKLTVSYYGDRDDRPLRMLCYRCQESGAPGMS